MKDPSAAEPNLPPVRSNTSEVLSTLDLLSRANGGDDGALNAICARYLPRLRLWASGRLPMDCRSLLDTEDLVQEAVIGTIQRLRGVDVRGEGALQAYFRQAVLNRVRDAIRWSRRRDNVPDGAATIPDRSPTPLEEAIGSEIVAAYEKALAGLPEDDQILIHLRLELDYGYAEIAAATGKPSANAARMATSRAVDRLSRTMRDEKNR
jgi:RNA polymerase sigma factor (sigma-70 family)